MAPKAILRTLYSARFRLMGGWGSLRFVDDRGEAAALRTATRARDEARRIEARYSRYRPDSIVSRINRDAGRTPVAVDEEAWRLVGCALQLARQTRGAFDPTSGIYRRVWDFRTGKAPSPGEIESLRPLVDHTLVRMRDGTVFLPREGMEIDLGGIGKEYAADRAAGLLRKEGITAGIVSFGGDVRTLGSRGDGRPWCIGVVDPRNPRRTRFRVRVVGDAGIATSGDYERCFVRDGVRHHHLLDARTGRPAAGVASCTAVATTAFDAGLASTAAFLLGADEGLRLLEDRPGVEGVLIRDSGELSATSGMSRLSDLPGSQYADYPLL
jgi:thiamine biosynthesis lipoprotein